MSKIALTPNASGSGTFTIASPNSDTDRTLTLPDEAGTVLTSASSIPAANITGQRYFYAYKTGTTTQGTIASNTDTKVELDGVIQSNTSWSTTNDEFVATADDVGDWLFTGQVSFYIDGNDGDNLRSYIFRDTGSGYFKDAGGYSWIWQGTDQVRHAVHQVQQIISISEGDKVALYGAVTGTNIYFFAGDSTSGYKQCSLIGTKLS